jgi:hypothetical protein
MAFRLTTKLLFLIYVIKISLFKLLGLNVFYLDDVQAGFS